MSRHARCDGQEDPYNAKKGFWYSHCGWLFIKSPYRDEKYEKQLRKDPLIMWQHRYYIPVVLSGLALPFIVGFFYGGWMSGLSCFILAGVGRTFFVLNSTFCINSICHMADDIKAARAVLQNKTMALSDLLAVFRSI